MIIKKCYIENFGKLHKFEYEFSSGINIINELNGWGKSTFATFIKVMFFGFENTAKRAISENERKKYYPWQGGKFGGNIEFEINGINYKIERFFGAKDKEDTFKLYNQNTNCESNDFSVNIGEEIFKIDRDAYSRSTYIPQQNISVKINDSLSAKLSNILESENDINSSDDAIEIINKIMKEYKKIGNKGKLNEIETKINNKKRELEYAEKNEKFIEERNKKIEILKIEIKSLEEQKNKNQEKINLFLENEKNKLKIDRYNEILSEIAKEEKMLENLNDYFLGKIPDDIEINNYEKITFELDTLFAKIDDNIVNDKDSNVYESLKHKFIGKNISENEINGFYLDNNEIENLKKDIIILKERLENQEKIEKISANNKKQKNIKLLISLLLIIFGIGTGWIINQYFYGISIFGLLILAFSLVSDKKENINSDKMSKAEIITAIDEKNIKLNTLSKKLEDFLNLFEGDNENIFEKITKIKNEFNSFQYLNKQINEKEIKRKQIQERIDQLLEEIYFGLKNYFNTEINQNNMVEFNLVCKNKIFEIKSKKKEYEDLKTKLENDKKLKEKYEIENNIKEIHIIQENLLETKEEIIEKNNILNEKIKGLINQKSYDENELNRLINTMVTTEEIETELENLNIEKEEISKKYYILDKTQKYLIKAKEQFSAHYLKGMSTGFEKYLKIIDGNNLKTNVDINLNVKIESDGENKETEYLSAGYKDLIGICMRFALVEALFENENPFIILDDPLVNLDAEKIEKAKEIINELSKKYQIIYFVCHESRI